jgi:repressor of nif and glnA expression
MFPENKEEGGLVQLEEAYIIEIKKLMEYVDSAEDPLIQVVRMHQSNTNGTDS